MIFEIMILPTIITAILFMPFGAFYYSEKGMGKKWLKAINKTSDEIKAEDSNMGLLMGGTIVLSLVTVILINFLIASLNIDTVFELFLLLDIVYIIILSTRLKNSLFDGNMALFKVNLLGILGEFSITFVVFAIFMVI